jgi:predicted nucleic acid-binding protein
MVEPVFFDTSVLVAGLIELGPAAEPAQRIMTAVAEGHIDRPCTAWHCCLEFFSVSTRLPAAFRLTPADALRLLEENVLARFQIWQLPESVQRAFLRIAAQEEITGGRVYDAHIGEIARQVGARIVVTDNRRHFVTLLSHAIQVLSTIEFCEQLDPG